MNSLFSPDSGSPNPLFGGMGSMGVSEDFLCKVLQASRGHHYVLPRSQDDILSGVLIYEHRFHKCCVLNKLHDAHLLDASSPSFNNHRLTFYSCD